MAIYRLHIEVLVNTFQYSMLKKLVVYQVGRLLFYLQFAVTYECPAFPVVFERPNEHLMG